MILITGATGQLGRLVIQSLITKIPAHEIVAAVRNVSKAEDLKKLGIQVRAADYSNPAQWPAALQGIDKVLLISGNEIGQRTSQHKTVIDAVAKAGTVRLLAYTSILHADRNPISLAKEHLETEKLIRASGVPFTFLRNGWYTENYTGQAESAIAQGAIYGAAKEGRISAAPRADYAEAAARVLTLKEKPKEIYELAGEKSFTLSDLAAEFSKRSGKPVQYIDMSEADYKAALLKVGLPEPIAAMLADADACAAKGALFDESHELSRLIG